MSRKLYQRGRFTKKAESPKPVWNSLEWAKLIMSAVTPITIGFASLWITSQSNVASRRLAVDLQHQKSVFDQNMNIYRERAEVWKKIQPAYLEVTRRNLNFATIVNRHSNGFDNLSSQEKSEWKFAVQEGDKLAHQFINFSYRFSPDFSWLFFEAVWATRSAADPNRTDKASQRRRQGYAYKVIQILEDESGCEFGTRICETVTDIEREHWIEQQHELDDQVKGEGDK